MGLKCYTRQQEGIFIEIMKNWDLKEMLKNGRIIIELEESQKGAEYLKVSKGVEKYIRVFKSRVEKFNNKNKISC